MKPLSLPGFGRRSAPRRQDPAPSPRTISQPSLEVSETDKEVLVKLEAPGLSEKDLELTHSEGLLHVKGEKKEEREDRRRDYIVRESWYGAFSRDIPIGAGVDWDKAEAQYRNGVLKVTLPKRPGEENRKGKSIPVE